MCEYVRMRVHVLSRAVIMLGFLSTRRGTALEITVHARWPVPPLKKTFID